MDNLKLKDKYSKERLKKTEKILGPELLEKLLTECEVKNLGELSLENGWFGIVVPIKNKDLAESVQFRVAASMNVDEETVDIEKNGKKLQASAEMCCGSQRMPWPEYAVQTLEDVNKGLEHIGHEASLVF